MITLLQTFLIIVIASFTSMANAADNQSPARVENAASTPITVKAVEKYTVSLLDYVDEDTKKAADPRKDLLLFFVTLPYFRALEAI